MIVRVQWDEVTINGYHECGRIHTVMVSGISTVDENTAFLKRYFPYRHASDGVLVADCEDTILLVTSVVLNRLDFLRVF